MIAYGAAHPWPETLNEMWERTRLKLNLWTDELRRDEILESMGIPKGEVRAWVDWARTALVEASG